MPIARPFLKWAGGKHRVVPELLKIIQQNPPLNCDWRVSPGSRYHEPFLGSGAMFFGLKNSNIIQTKQHSFLSDLNPALINTMNVVKDVQLLPNLVERLRYMQEEYGKKGLVPKNSSKSERSAGMYYQKRKQLNDYLTENTTQFDRYSVEFAALTIFLNKTCFNGLWRMNNSGQFNVPEGDYIKPQNICQEDLLRTCNHLLKNTKIIQKDWKDAMKGKNVNSGDLIYLDPPYMPLRIEDEVFNSYFTEGFSEDDQVELAASAAVLASKGAKVIASNHDALGDPTIRKIWKDAAASAGSDIHIKKITLN